MSFIPRSLFSQPALLVLSTWDAIVFMAALNCGSDWGYYGCQTAYSQGPPRVANGGPGGAAGVVAAPSRAIRRAAVVEGLKPGTGVVKLAKLHGVGRQRRAAPQGELQTAA